MMRAVILGATSSIAQATQRLLAEQGWEIYLVARNSSRLASLAADLRVMGASDVFITEADLADETKHELLIEEIFGRWSKVDLVLIAYGILGDQKQAQRSWKLARNILHTNFVSSISLIERFAEKFESQRTGTIAAISSVAGDRGRQSNYLYGASKGGLTTYLEGLRNRLFHSNVHVLTVKPGFVRTPMTAHLPQGPMFVTPEVVAKAIVRALASKRNTIYVPCFWFFIMMLIRHIPERLFKRLKL